ncbi:S-adenosyl-L-methionine-dependent methyltransferase [Linnemannia elongata]|nr:S-adenosyl-L-methionine-dependent methyltransferase [Linnemannia elongata]
MAANQGSHEAFLKLRELRKSHLETPSTPTSTLPEWAYHSRCCDDGRTRHIVENAPYMLPNDLPESDRLDAQHYLVRFILKGNYNVHLDSESPDLRILDVATGTGVWALEMAREFPKAEIHGVDISAIFPTEGNPPNCNFQLCNILDGLPFPDNHFDFIYQRLLVYALSPAQRRQVNVELLRVLKPEGFLQLVESDGIVYNPGPQMEKINQLSLETSLRHGVDPRVVQTMKSGLKQSGYTNVNSVNIALPVGAWGGKVGSLSLQNMHGLATIWLRGEVGNMTRDECDALLMVADKECEVNQSYYKVWLVIGAKPKEPKNITASSSTTTTPNTSGKAQVLASTSSSSSDTPRVSSSRPVKRNGL